MSRARRRRRLVNRICYGRAWRCDGQISPGHREELIVCDAVRRRPPLRQPPRLITPVQLRALSLAYFLMDKAACAFSSVSLSYVYFGCQSSNGAHVRSSSAKVQNTQVEHKEKFRRRRRRRSRRRTPAKVSSSSSSRSSLVFRRTARRLNEPLAIED